RCGSSSYPGSSVATFPIPRTTRAVCRGRRRARSPRGLGRVSSGATARGGDVYAAVGGTPVPSGALLPYPWGKIHPVRTRAGGRPGRGLPWPAFPARQAPAMRRRDRLPGLAMTVLLLTTSCAQGPSVVPPDPGVTFAAHPENGGFVLDRLKSG